MRVLLLLCLAASASAQTPVSADSPNRPVILTAGGVAGGAATVLVGYAVLGAAGASENARYWVPALYPVGAAVTVYALGRNRGGGGTLGATLLGAAVGTLVVPGGVLLAAWGIGEALGENEGLGVLLFLTGATVVLLAPPALAAIGFDISDAPPVVRTRFEGPGASGLTFRVGL